MEALNCEDESRVEELLISASEAKLDKEVGNCEHDDHDDQVEQGEGGQPQPSNKNFRALTEICYIDVYLSGGRDGGADGEQHKFGEQFLFWGEKR